MPINRRHDRRCDLNKLGWRSLRLGWGGGPHQGSGLKSHHTVVISVRTLKQQTFERETPNLTTPLAQANGKRSEIGIARSDREKPYTRLEMQSDRVGDQSSIGRVLFDR